MPAHIDEDDITRPNSVLGKAQLLLEAFESGTPQLTLTELSKRSGIPKASAHRLAQELVQWGLLERQGDSYQLGMQLFSLGQRVPASAMLRTVARPLLTDLFARTRATLHLAVLDGTHVFFLEKIAGAANIHTHSQVGGRLPASCTATGKVLLALHPGGPEAVKRLPRTGLPSLTPRSVATVEKLEQQLAAVADRGYALEHDEVLSGHSSLAVPVTGMDGTVHAAVSATATTARMRTGSLLPELWSAAADIARRLDHATRPLHCDTEG
ncbi:IclR family transcriptional regulator [Streptomyces sp. Ru73]|uniref:IclR family transcriptional regulator n=1 Tax=Streptomyces sp. Ru73 TaxID=2080748 RepID=UPI000CDCFD11|nr:IclR family transcriptional regulator [Streptomyces sp. Ru73]POX42920.1 IclR family transcriptional regulator [Streptomyces sp. Ru73]